MKLVDVHCHLEAEEFVHCLDELLADARKAGIVKLLTAAVVPEDWDTSRAIAQRFEEVEFALGIHPWYVKREHLACLDLLGDARNRGAKAIGEIGLDAKIPAPPMPLQLEAFRCQLEIAKDLDLPVVVHCRGAFNDLLATVRQVGLPRAGGVIHAFSGSIELVEELVKCGFYFSMGGSLTYRNSKKRREVLRRIYPDRFMIETDSPDIPPVEAPGKPNVPANICHNLRAASETLGESEERIAEHTTNNATRVFSLDI